MGNEILAAWKFEVASHTYRIPVRIINPETNISIIKYCIFDTGFTGYCALESLTITQLGIKKIGVGKAITARGFVDYENFEAKIEIVNDEKKTILPVLNVGEPTNYSKPIPIQEMGINLIGMKAINQSKWLILGDQQILILIEK